MAAIGVDPIVWIVAEAFVDGMAKDLGLRFLRKQREGMVRRVGEAMQRALESELDALQQELGR